MKNFLKKLNPIDQVVLIILIGGFVFAGLYAFMPTWVAPRQASADNKSMDTCSPTDTVGHCADKCPANTSEGAYYIQGYDKDTGAVVCGFDFYNACPYAEAVSADDPICTKLKAEQQPITTSIPSVVSNTPTIKNTCGGQQ